ncbi:DUF302 domain-containing protein [Streptomyces sp. GbtcB6]|uniref:DUF302 domain-containing protein n=1 Tax=Streptomyces sp. GbtcB6 TaxID=2824751 RepID=UPI001C2FCBB1|nr:DUF302 domain-containing protein [Streptomyces sp. GbtcB6]
MAIEYVLRTALERHIINTRRHFTDVIGDIRAEIDARETTGGQVDRLVLARCGEVDPDRATALAPGVSRLVRLVLDKPSTTAELARTLPDVGLYCPVSILVQQITDGGTRLSYDSVASAIAVHQDEAATAVAQSFDAEILEMLRRIADRD